MYIFAVTPTGKAPLVEHQPLDHEVMGSNLPAVQKVTLGSHCTSLYISVKLGSGDLAITIDSEDHYLQMRVMVQVHPPWL